MIISFCLTGMRLVGLEESFFDHQDGEGIENFEKLFCFYPGFGRGLSEDL